MALSKITAASITSNVISSALIANGEITFADIASNLTRHQKCIIFRLVCPVEKN